MQLGSRILEALTCWQDYDFQSPADTYIHNKLKGKSYIGSSDRREIRHLFYKLLRHQETLKAALALVMDESSPKHIPKEKTYRWMLLMYLTWIQDKQAIEQGFRHAGLPHHPSPLEKSEEKFLQPFDFSSLSLKDQCGLNDFWYGKLYLLFPEDLKEHCDALNEEAHLDLRFNTLKLKPDQAHTLLSAHNIKASPLPYSPFGLRVDQKIHFPSSLIREGYFEPQDEGSQLITLLCDVKPSMRVLDYCAGAGGKTLGIAMLMKNKGMITACDVADFRLQRARVRFRRLDLHNISCKVIDKRWNKQHHHSFDRVLIDAPCSGSGTWRRNPDLKYRMDDTALHELVLKQREILTQGAPLVKKGGRLLYTTCSLLEEENNTQIQWFLEHFPGFKLIPLTQVWQDLQKARLVPSSTPAPLTTPTWSLTPFHHNTDGFFISCLERSL